MMNFLYLIFIYPIELLIELVFQLTYHLTDDCGISIAAVSLAVSFLSLPLYIIAERWQQKERNLQAQFKPEIEEIKAVFKGDEQYMILSTFYRQNHYHPIMALRSSISLMIQVPFFIAAYAYLSNLEMLKGQSLWFFEDLGAPDALFVIGNFPINVLPITMTFINVAASAVYVKGFAFKEKLQLYGMAALFLILLYNSPAGLVLYWTLNNVFSLCKNICYKLKFKEPENCKRAVKKVLNLFRKPLHPLYENDKARFSIFFLCCVLLLLLVGTVIPSSLISSSVYEFSYIDPFKNPLSLLKFPFFQTMGIAVWCIGLYFLFSRKVQTVFTFIMMVAISCALVNTYALSGNYGMVLVDQGLYFENGLKIKNELAKFPIDFVVAISIILMLLFFIFRKKLGCIKNVGTVIVFSLLAFGIFNVYKINSSFNAIDKIVSSEGLMENSRLEPVFHFSKKGKNVVVIMLDRGISSFVPEIFNELSECHKNFSGFVYYPNTISPGDHTILAAPSLFGGYDYIPENMNLRSSETQISKHNEALNVLPRYFINLGYSATVTDAPLANYSWIPDNSIFGSDVHALNLSSRYAKHWREEYGMDIPGWKLSDTLKRNFLFFDFFRVFPVSLRGILYFHGTWWNSNSDKGRDIYSTLIKWYSVLDYLPELSDTTASCNSYIAMENDTTHEPTWMSIPDYKLEKDVLEDNREDNLGGETALLHFHINAATIRMLGEWFSWMKENCVYDNTRIVIASDHGRKFSNSLIVSDYDVKEICRYNSLLLYKDFCAFGDVRTDDEFMSCADVPFLATLGTDPAPANPFTGTLFSENTKKSGFHVFTGPVEANQHNKNSFVLTEEKVVKNNIFHASSWEVMK